MAAAGLKAHRLEYPCYAVAHCGSRRKGKVNDPERYIQPLAGFHCHQLADTGDAECGLFNGFGNYVERFSADGFQSALYNAGAADPD